MTISKRGFLDGFSLYVFLYGTETMKGKELQTCEEGYHYEREICRNKSVDKLHARVKYENYRINSDIHI